MANKKVAATVQPQAKRTSWLTSQKLIWAGFALAVLIFYWTPLFDDQATIQWDTVDVHYSAQKYFEQSLRTTGLPFWTPFEFSGMPFLADPQTAAWYPVHWLFFLIGITPRALEWELALHAFLALAGAFLFARKLLHHDGAAAVAAVFYAFGGFFAGHSSHLGIFETAALLPWLLWSALVAVETGTLSAFVGTGLVAGLVVLAGHFQTALYSFFALAMVLAVHKGPVKRRLSVIAAAVGIGFLISAVQVLPGLELAAQSIRAASDSHAATNAPLNPGALANLILPNSYGVLSGEYKGPGDITQFYFYQGLLLIPLALAGFARRKMILIPIALIVPALWYALGPGTGLYSVLTLLPGFKNIRAPVHIWFVVALGLALSAGLGFIWLSERWKSPWILAAILAVVWVDAWHSNMSANPLAYGRASFAQRYDDAYHSYQSHIAPVKQRPFYRIWAPYPTNFFGPLNSSLESRTEVSYGYNPLEIQRYAHYLDTVEQNPRLLDGLAVTHKMDFKQGAMLENPGALQRVSVPSEVRFVANADAAHAMLATLNPAQFAIVEGPARAISPAPAQVQILDYRDDFYRIRYVAGTECLLRIAVPFFPGWAANIDGHAAAVVPVDYALSGVFVPAGRHEMVFQYRSRWFRLGAIASLITAIACLGLILRQFLRLSADKRG